MSRARGDRGIWLAALGLGAVAVAWRVVLSRVYFGSEEEDYGNLGLITGTLRSGFTYIETEHMPLFTTVAAAITAVVGDAELAGEILAVGMGGVAVGALTWIGWRWLGPATGVLAGLLLVFQPDAALTAATPLRISTYMALSLTGVALLASRRPLGGAVVFAAAFLTRFDLAFTLLPALAILALWRRDRRTGLAVGIVASVVLGWSFVYRTTEGTWAFWGDVAARSTGGDAFFHPGTVGNVLLHMVPLHLGHVVLLAAPVGVVLALRRAASDDLAVRWLALCGGAALGFFCLAVGLSSYRWDHNLFWKWLCGASPYILLFGSFTLVTLVQSLMGTGRAGRIRLVPLSLAILGSIAAAYSTVTRAQLERSDLWYGTQVRLVDWVERAYPDDVTLVADLIPATYLSRRASERVVLRWSQDTVPQLKREPFGDWLLERGVALVITFDEEWVGSADKAPFLVGLQPVRAGPATLTPIAREEEYGFIAWQVSGREDIPQPSGPPPASAGGLEGGGAAG